MATDEIEALKVIDELLSSIDDPQTLSRVVGWIRSKYGQQSPSLPSLPGAGVRTNPLLAPGAISERIIVSGERRELPGIAIMEEGGRITFTVRDVKAKNANDAVVRLALIAAYVHEAFTGDEVLPRKTVLVPLLGDWRVNTGNARTAIAKHRGIIPVSTYELKLDSHAKQEAERIINEMLDPEIKGKWSPSLVGRRARGRNKKDNTELE